MGLFHRFSRAIGAALAVGLLAFAAPSAHALTSGAAQAHVERVSNQVLSIIRSPGDLRTKESQFRGVLLSAANVRQIAGFAVGRYGRVMTESQKRRYVDLFVDYSVRAYTRRFDEYQGQELRVIRVVDAGQRGYYVKTEIANGGSAPLSVEWIVDDRSGAVMVNDMIVEGVSLAQLTRDEFTAMLSRRGGDIEAFLSALQSAIASL